MASVLTRPEPYGFFGLEYFGEQSVLYFSQKFGYSQAKIKGGVGQNKQWDPTIIVEEFPMRLKMVIEKTVDILKNDYWFMLAKC